MGPVFYLVQSNGVLRPISTVLLGNWPHEFALALLLGKREGGGCTPCPVAGGVFGWFLSGLRCEKGSVLRSGAALERPQ